MAELAIATGSIPPFVKVTNEGLSVTAYPGVGRVLLAFDLDPAQTNNLAGFAVLAQAQGTPYYLGNSLNFSTPAAAHASISGVGSRSGTPSDVAPFQRFRLTDVPDGPIAGYQVTAMYFAATGLTPGPTVALPLDLDSGRYSDISLGFNRGFLSADAYSERFANRTLRPETPSIDYDTSPYADLYAWLGAEARRLTVEFLTSAVLDHEITVDGFLFDVDEPDLIRLLAQLGPRLRVIMDDSPVHGPDSREARARALLRERGASVQDGHFAGLSHSKVLVQRRKGVPVSVLTGSTNLTVQSLYVKPNCVVVVENRPVATRYAEAFDQALADMTGFANSAIARQWFDFEAQDRTLSTCFAPHSSAGVSLDRVTAAIESAGSSVLFSAYETAQQRSVIAALQEVAADPRLFTRGLMRGRELFYYRSGQAATVVANPSRNNRIPAGFAPSLPMPIYQSFVIVDFNGDDPIVFTGSSNYGGLSETRNGDNLLAIRDPAIASAYAAEAVRLFDWFAFDVRVNAGFSTLQGPSAPNPWWRAFYEEAYPVFHERRLLAAGHGNRVRTAGTGRLAGYRSDSDQGIDQLGFDREVSALCTVIAAREVKPPLSVGLFGDWGTGKSFFMGMMQKRIEELAGHSRRADADGRPSDFCRNVKQIRFNAWHYVDANLWASLVSQIFHGLGPAEGDDLERHLGELASSQMLKSEKEIERDEVVKQKEAIDGDLVRVRRQRHLLKNVRLTVAAGMAGALALAEDPEVKKRIDEFNRKNPGLDVNAEALKDEARDLSTIWGKLGRVWTLFWKSVHPALWLSLLGLLVIFSVGLFFLTRMLAPSIIAAFVISAVGLLRDLKGPIATVRQLTMAATAGAERLSQLETAARSQREQELQAKLKILAEREKQLSDEAARADQQAANLQKEIDDIQHGRRIVSFIEQRAISTDYTQKLGVVAMIRNDFEKLSDLLAEANQAAQSGRTTGPSVERIILYIDDLDRCPARLVVNVLEAVHLLLAFELFVVVVGVDSRWLLRSLRQHYALQLGTQEDEKDGSTALTDLEATPQNFLEKIFQIPFCVKPMEKVGFGRLVASMFPAAAPARPAAPTPAAASMQPAPVDTPTTGQPAVVPAVSLPTMPQEEAADGADRFVPTSQPISWGPIVDLQPAALQVSEREVTFMKGLSEMVPTPRSAKRLANTYRLIRASMEPAELASFEATTNLDHQVVLTLLGILVGFGDLAPSLFSDVMNARSGDWWQVAGRLAGPSHTAVVDGSSSTDEAEARARLVRCLNNLRPQTSFPKNLDVFKKWAPAVARYSFRINWEVAAPPPPAATGATPQREHANVRSKSITSGRRR